MYLGRNTSDLFTYFNPVSGSFRETCSRRQVSTRPLRSLLGKLAIHMYMLVCSLLPLDIGNGFFTKYSTCAQSTTFHNINLRSQSCPSCFSLVSNFPAIAHTYPITISATSLKTHLQSICTLRFGPSSFSSRFLACYPGFLFSSTCEHAGRHHTASSGPAHHGFV